MLESEWSGPLKPLLHSLGFDAFGPRGCGFRKGFRVWGASSVLRPDVGSIGIPQPELRLLHVIPTPISAGQSSKIALKTAKSEGPLRVVSAVS